MRGGRAPPVAVEARADMIAVVVGPRSGLFADARASGGAALTHALHVDPFPAAGVDRAVRRLDRGDRAQTLDLADPGRGCTVALRRLDEALLHAAMRVDLVVVAADLL